MKLSRLPSSKNVLKKDLRDPKFRAEWERTALARAIASQVIGYRVEHGLSQTALAKRLGMKQPAVARLEAGEVTPSLETLQRLVSVLDTEIVIDLVPPEREPKLVTRRAQTSSAVEKIEAENYSLLIAAG
jgi:transcriptional regulator with XRE-family HTH domain